VSATRMMIVMQKNVLMFFMGHEGKYYSIDMQQYE